MATTEQHVHADTRHTTETFEQQMAPDEREHSPLLEAKRFDDPSVFTPESLLTEARRQKDLPDSDVPDICILDPDGDIVRHLVSTGRAEKDRAWPG
ncbi:MAG: hypothetical protein V5A13_06135, partial [Haloarculaceae archaeon]